MDDDKRTTGEKTLGELFTEAGGDDDGELDLGDGFIVRKTVCGGVVVDGRDLGELSTNAVENVARKLRAAAGNKYYDPARNPFIKIPE